MEERHAIVTYRLDRATIHELCAQFEPDLMSAIRHPTGIPPLVHVLSVLHLLASWSFHTTVAMASGMSQPLFSNVLSTVLPALLKHMCSYNVLPQVEDLPTVKGDFYALGHIPNIIGAIDGTHVALVPPRRSEQVYRNQKSYHSMNVQMVCLADQYISHVNAKFPGSVHDAYILRNSSIPYVMGQLQSTAVCTANGIRQLKDCCVDSWVMIVWAYSCWRDGGGFAFATLSLTFGATDLCGCLYYSGFRFRFRGS
ncbi:hypothetical protein NDU88_002846 [Pleurodeles waltl]|uniref:DDE Tnp4 domain-containing protein n=1 Tax=Pleurodeles waltl TaxID=8319 RepID=A0AAV7VBQ5_PLEWA|nr:hypothetical protein NDU88_002846 [Pleurodeles waltl]